jgi:hypothetical protein
MDHDYIEKFDLVDQYLIGTLVAEERERFEEHLISCTRCIDLLKTTREFRQGLRVLTLQQSSQKEGLTLNRPRWSFLQRRGWLLAACCLLLVSTITSVLLFSQVRRLRSEVEQANSAASEWQQLYAQQQESAISSEQQRQEMEQYLLGQIQQLKEAVEGVAKQRPGAEGESSDWSQPGVNVPIFVLNSVRGAGQTSSGINEIRLSNSAMNFVISLPLEERAQYNTYRVIIFAGRRPYWESSGLRPDRDNALTIGFNSRFFRPGDYSIVVEGIPRKQDSRITNYPFRVVKNS